MTAFLGPRLPYKDRLSAFHFLTATRAENAIEK